LQELLMNPRLLSVLFTGVVALGVTACGGGDATTDAAAPAPSPAAPAAPAPSPAAPAPAPAAPSPSPSAPAPAPSASGSGSAAECFNIAWSTPGTTAVLEYAITGSATGTTRSNLTVTGGKTFNGQTGLIEYAQDQTTTYTAPTTLALAGAVTTRSRHHLTENGSVETEYGGTVEVSAQAPFVTMSPNIVTTTTTVTYTPARVDRRFTLSAGASDTVTTSYGSSSVTSLGSVVPPTTTAQTITVNYAGQETVTVPAGTFTACKFLVTVNSETHTEWFGKGNGAPLQFTSRTSEGQVITNSLTSASRLNGAAIAPN
jgi:hypothetical protein